MLRSGLCPEPTEPVLGALNGQPRSGADQRRTRRPRMETWSPRNAVLWPFQRRPLTALSPPLADGADRRDRATRKALAPRDDRGRVGPGVVGV